MQDVSGLYRYTHMTDAGQTVTMMLSLTQVGTQIRGKLRSIFAAAGEDQLYYTEEHELQGEWSDGPILLSLPHGEIRVRAVAGGLEVTREQTELWKKL